MSVEFPPSHPTNPASASKPTDVQTLQSAFAAALRGYVTHTGGTDAMLEVLSTADNASDRHPQRRENQQHTNRTDLTQIDRKLLDKSEVRQSDIHADYRTRVDRHETLRNDYQERVERRDSAPPTMIPTNPSQANTSIHSPPAPPQPSELPPMRNDASPPNIIAAVASTPHSFPAVGVAAPNSVAPNGPAAWAMPQVATPQAALPQTLTIFTAAGRFGQAQEKSDDKEDEDEKEERDDSTDEKPIKKKTPFALFDAIHTEITRPIRRGHVRQEPLAQTAQPPIAEKLRATPRENEQPRNEKAVKSLEELLNTSHHVLAPKKTDPPPPDQTHYFKRIADACAAASRFAPIRIKINLDHLGTLTLRFFYQSDKLMLRFETPSKESARFLREHMDGLKTILSERNVSLASIEVWLADSDAA